MNALDGFHRLDFYDDLAFYNHIRPKAFLKFDPIVFYGNGNLTFNL